MFKIEIHGYFESKPTERETRNLDFSVYGEKLANYHFTTPVDMENTEKEIIVLSFYRQDFSPYLPKNMLNYYLDEFNSFKDRILNELNFACTDINLSTGKKDIISLNKATMNSFTYQSKIFYYDTDDIFYYTYENDGLHMVWIENTETLLNKARLIERKGFKGIFIRDVSLTLDGNWEALYNMKKDWCLAVCSLGHSATRLIPNGIKDITA